jgi:hypothetical protein
VQLEQVERGVDLFGQPDVVDQLGDHPMPPWAVAFGALGQLVGDVRPPEHRAGEVRGDRPRPSPGALRFIWNCPPVVRDFVLVDLIFPYQEGVFADAARRQARTSPFT